MNALGLVILICMLVYEGLAMLSRYEPGPKIPTITHSLVMYIPWWVTIPASLWLVLHLVIAYHKNGKI